MEFQLTTLSISSNSCSEHTYCISLETCRRSTIYLVSVDTMHLHSAVPVTSKDAEMLPVAIQITMYHSTHLVLLARKTASGTRRTYLCGVTTIMYIH